MRNSRPYRFSAPFAGLERHSTVISFPPSAADTSVQISGLSGDAGFFEEDQPNEIKSWGWGEAEQTRDLVAHPEVLPGFLSVSYSVFSTCYLSIYITITTRRVHTRCHTLQESINKVQYFQIVGRLQNLFSPQEWRGIL